MNKVLSQAIKKAVSDFKPKIEIKDKNKTEFKSEKFFSPLVLNIASRENISLSDLENIVDEWSYEKLNETDRISGYIKEKLKNYDFS